MLHVHFFLRNAENASPDARLIIYLQLEIEGHDRDVPISTRLKIPYRYWWNFRGKHPGPPIDAEGNYQWVLKPFEDAEEINRRLAAIRRTWKEVSDSIQTLSDEPISYAELRRHCDPKTHTRKIRRTPTFLEVLDELIKYKREQEDIEESTYYTYRTRKKNIELYLEAEKLTSIKVSEVRFRHIDRLQRFLKSVKNADGSERFGLDHRNKHATLMKQVLEFALNQEYIENMPVADLNLTYSPPKRANYIRAAQRQKIYDCKLATLSRCRDIAVFLMHTGFSYVDYCELSSSHLDGEIWVKQRAKSDIWSLPPLLPQAYEIIQKYGSIEALPRPDLSDLNKELKFLGDVCGLTKATVGFNLSTSVFRETFASMMENEFGYKRSDIKFMMGHTNERQLRNYSEMQPGTMLRKYQKNENLKAG